MRRILLAGVSTLLLALATATATATPAGAWTLLRSDAHAQAPTVPDCSAPFDSYDYTRNALSACGIRTFPLSSITALPGGGSRYSYDEPGGVVSSLLIPPAGLNLATASPARLQEYGLPTAPPPGTSSLTWAAQLARLKIQAPPAFLVSVRAWAETYYDTLNWSGYADLVNSPGKFDGVIGAYDEPSYNNTTCASANTPGEPSQAAVVWSGIGGFTSPMSKTNSQLGQDGTANDVPGLANHQEWYEVYPHESIQPLPYTAATGNEISAKTIEASAGSGEITYSGTVIDQTTDTTEPWSQTLPSSNYTGESIEMIAERPGEQVGSTDYYTPLANFGTLTVNGLQQALSPNNSTFYLVNSSLSGLTQVTMENTDSGPNLAAPSSYPIDEYGQFEDDWDSCGTDEVAPN